MLAEVVKRTGDVFTRKVALVAPAGTVTLEGTLAAPLLLESRICAPPAGAAPLSVTVPVEDCVPPTTLVGFSESEERVIGGGDAGATVSEADLVAPPKDAAMVTTVDAATALVLTVNDALVAPAATVTLEGTRAAVVLLLESVTMAPPAGAAPLKVTVPVEEFPPVTRVGFSESAERVAGAGAEDGASSKSKIAGLGSFCETATNFEAEII